MTLRPDWSICSTESSDETTWQSESPDDASRKPLQIRGLVSDMRKEPISTDLIRRQCAADASLPSPPSRHPSRCNCSGRRLSELQRQLDDANMRTSKSYDTISDLREALRGSEKVRGACGCASARVYVRVSA